MKKAIILVVSFFFLTGGGGENLEGCDCGDWPASQPTDTMPTYTTPSRPADFVLTPNPPAIEVEPRAATEQTPNKVEEVKKAKILKTIKVKKGRYPKWYVDQTKGADLKATFVCNGWKEGTNPKVKPGQKIKICRW